jgi:arylsulfatase
VIDIVPTNINEDFSQANTLADKYPDKLKELQDAFDVEAKKYNVYPLDSSFASRADPAIRPSLTRGRSEFVYFPGMVRHRTSKTNPGPSPPR